MIVKRSSLITYSAEAVILGLQLIILLQILSWDIPGVWFRTVAIVSFIFMLLIGFYLRSKGTWRCDWSANKIKELLFLLGGIGFLISLLLFIHFNNEKTRQSIELLFPLHDTRWYIAQGGNSPLLNQHYSAKAQRGALDVTVLNRWGFRAKGLLPSDLKKYAAYGAIIHAPCDGVVLAARTGQPDLIPPSTDSTQPAGNFVSIFCKNTTIILAHLKSGSVRVVPEENIKKGDILGEVGNSGNTSEPHLHIHAVEGKTQDMNKLLRYGDPVTMLFNGRHLKRNSNNF